MSSEPIDNCRTCGTPLCGMERIEDQCPACLAERPSPDFEAAQGHHVTLCFVTAADESERWYLVRWEIDLEAASAVEAARKALAIQRDPTSLATVFSVRPVGADGAEAEVDIDLLLTPGNESDR